MNGFCQTLVACLTFVCRLHPQLVDLLSLPVQRPLERDQAALGVDSEGLVVVQRIPPDGVAHPPVGAYVRVHRPDADHLRAERRVLRHSDRLVGGGEYELRGVVIEILGKTGTLDDDNNRIHLDKSSLDLDTDVEGCLPDVRRVAPVPGPHRHRVVAVLALQTGGGKNPGQSEVSIVAS